MLWQWMRVSSGRILLRCLDATLLAYGRDFYQQTFGTSMGSPVSVTVYSQPCNEGCVAESTVQLPVTTPFLEEVRGWHADSSAPGASPVLPRTHKLHRIHHWNGVGRHTTIPGHQDHPSQWWVPVNHGVPKENTHGQVSGLQVTSPLGAQGGSGTDSVQPGWKDLHRCPRHRQGEGACCKGPPKQWVPQRTGCQKLDTYITAATT